jgi:hypothetical protein
MARFAPVNAFVLTGTSFFDRLGSRAEADQTWRLIVRHANIVSAPDSSQLFARLGAQVAVTPLDALPEAIATAIGQFTIGAVVERLADTESKEQWDLLTQLEAQGKRIAELEASFSWRVTSLLRGIYRLLSGLFGGLRLR